MTWNPTDYVPGKYFQNEINTIFQKRFKITLFGDVLDVGCGDGEYTHTLAQSFENAHFLGIDNSETMIQHANQHWLRNNITFERHDIETFTPSIAFDSVVSFWCLHWTNIEASLANILRVLKKNGEVYAVFSSLAENSILQTLQALAAQNRYCAYINPYIHAADER